MRTLLLRVLLLLAMAGTVACGEKQMVIYNGCAGSWVRVRDGRGNLLAERIDYGQESVIGLDSYVGQNLELLAMGYELRTNRTLGSNNATRWVAGSGGPLSSTQIQPWRIEWLYPGGCPG